MEHLFEGVGVAVRRCIHVYWRDHRMGTMYNRTDERSNDKIVYLNEYRTRMEREQRRAEEKSRRRTSVPVSASDLFNLGMAAMILVSTGMILAGM